jgi:hypothetical protein
MIVSRPFTGGWSESEDCNSSLQVSVPDLRPQVSLRRSLAERGLDSLSSWTGFAGWEATVNVTGMVLGVNGVAWGIICLKLILSHLSGTDLEA